MKRKKPFQKLQTGGRVTSNNPSEIAGRNSIRTKPSIFVDRPVISKDDLDCSEVINDPQNPGYTYRYGCVPKQNANQKIKDYFAGVKPDISVVECRNDRDCGNGEVCEQGQCVPFVSDNTIPSLPDDIVPLQCRNDRDCGIGNFCRNGTCYQRPVDDPIIIDEIGPQEYYCNGVCEEIEPGQEFTCDNLNSSRYGQVVNRMEDCYSVMTMPDGRRWMTENLQQRRITDGITQADGTLGSYLIPGQGGVLDITDDNWSTTWNTFGNNPAILLFSDDSMDYTTYYNFWAADTFGTSEIGICPPGWHVPTLTEYETLLTAISNIRNEETIGKALKEQGFCPPMIDNCDSNNDGFVDAYWNQSTQGAMGTDDFYFSARGYGYVDAENIPQLYSFREVAGFWTSTKYGQQSVGYVISVRYNLATVQVGFDQHGGAGNASDGYNIRCVEGDIITADDGGPGGGDVFSWWERMEDYVHLSSWNPDGNTWIPAEVCINDPNIPCGDTEEFFQSNFDVNIKRGDLRAENVNTRLDCPTGPVFYDPSSGATIPFPNQGVGVSPGGCVRTTYLGLDYDEIDIGESEPINDIGCCDLVLQVYGLQQSYSINEGSLHNCFYTDGIWKYQCGGCSCPTTPNAFSVVYPAYHFYNNPANWEHPTGWIGDEEGSWDGSELPQYVDGYQFGGTLESGGYAESIGPSCPDLMCVGGTYNGMYCSGDNFYGVDEGTCSGGGGTCLNGSGCSWGFKQYPAGAVYAAGWNGNDYSCCPGCQTPATTPNGTIDGSCINDFTSIDKSELNWADYGWNYSMVGWRDYNWQTPNYIAGENWVASEASWEEWAVGICGVSHEVCLPTSGWPPTPEIDCEAVSFEDCPDFEVGDSQGDISDEYCYYPNDGISPGGCCGKDIINQKCIYKGCQVYEDCMTTMMERFGQDWCVENCQDVELLSGTLKYPSSEFLIGEGFAYNLDTNELTLCLSDSDGDGICDVGEEEGFEDCPTNHFDCNLDCCDPTGQGAFGYPDCAITDDCGACVLGQTGLLENYLDVGCGCYGNNTQGPNSVLYYLDSDDDLLGDPTNSISVCMQGGQGCLDSDTDGVCDDGVKITSNTNLNSYLLHPDYVGNPDDANLSYDSEFGDPNPDTTIGGDTCASNTVGCNGCCSDDQTTYPDLPVCGTFDACGNCVPQQDNPGLYCTGTGFITCGDGIVADGIDLKDSPYIMAGCDGFCCSQGVGLILEPTTNKNFYDTCHTFDYFYQDTDGDGFAAGSGLGDPLCQFGGVPDGDYPACQNGNIGGYCLASDTADIDGESCYCPENVDSSGYIDGSNSCYDCMGICRERQTEAGDNLGLSLCDTDADGNVVPNQISGCATIDPNAGVDYCPTNHCIYGSSAVQDACVQGCDTIGDGTGKEWFPFGDGELECPGIGALDGCGTCGGTCCDPDLCPGDSCPTGCLECGCFEITGGSLGSQIPGEVCDCNGTVVDECGVCGGPGKTACNSTVGCNPTQFYCDSSTPEYINGNQVGAESCDILDGCGVCNPPDHVAPYTCSGFTEGYNAPCNNGNDTYCFDAVEECPNLDGCGVCVTGGGYPQFGEPCTNFSSTTNNTTAQVVGSEIIITLGDFCLQSQTYCPDGQDTFDVGSSSTNCTNRFDCAGNCFSYDDSTGTWETGASVFDECGVCRLWDGIGNWIDYNNDDVGCGCNQPGPETFYYDYDGDAKPDPSDSAYYQLAEYCITLGDLLTSNSSDAQTQPANTECGVDVPGWCNNTDWDNPIDGQDMFDCPCNQKDCNGNCCIFPGEQTGICNDTGTGWTAIGNQSGNYCQVPDCEGTCGGSAELDECGICNGVGQQTFYYDADGDGLGEQNVSQTACAPPGDNWVLVEGDLFDDYPNCNCPEDDETCVDCQGVCKRNPDGTLIDCASNPYQGGCAYLDMCNQCVHGTTNEEPCVQDCNGEWGGSAFEDQCGVCCNYSGGPACNADLDCNNACPGDTGYPHFLDTCSQCVPAETDPNGNEDCNGDCFGDAFLDPNWNVNCCNTANGYFECVGGNTFNNPCTQDCNDEWGCAARIDECGVCAGGYGSSSGITPGADDVGCGCFFPEPALFYYDGDGDTIPDNPAPFPSSPSYFCETFNSANNDPSFSGGPCSGHCPEIPCPNPPVECYQCGYQGGWCPYDSANPLPGGDPWDMMPNCPCNNTHCDSGLTSDCCNMGSVGSCNGHNQPNGDPYPQCLLNDACGNCGGSCICSGKMITNADGNLECVCDPATDTNCVDGEPAGIICAEADSNPAVHYLAVGCGNVCVLYDQIPSFDACGDCGGACFTPEVPGSGGCQECGCESIVEIWCDDDNDGVIDGNCPGGSVGSIVPGEYCNCDGLIVDACQNCGGGCSCPGTMIDNGDGTYTCDHPAGISCSASQYNTVVAGCDGICGSGLVNDQCGVCGGPGAIYNCADLTDGRVCGGDGNCSYDNCYAPDACGNCGGDCQVLDSGYIQCGGSVNNQVVNGCNGVCTCGATNGIPNYSDVNGGICHSFDYCGFCVPHETGYVGQGEPCDNAPDPYCGDGMFYCPEGGVGDANLANYDIPGTCNQKDICGVCNGPGTEIVDANGIEVSIPNGGYCPGGESNIGKVCNCNGDTCDECGVCGGDDSECTGCILSTERCDGITNGTATPCNAGYQSGGSACYNWGNTGPNSCKFDDGTTCNCPLGSTPCFYDGDCDGDREVGTDYYLECIGLVAETCVTSTECNPLALTACGAEYEFDGTTYQGQCQPTQGTLSTGCMTPGECNYDVYADIADTCYGPGEDIYTCGNWGFECTPNFGNGGDMLDGVQSCEPGNSVTNWTHWYPNVPNHTVDMNEAGCFNPIDDRCGCTNGPASQYYECLPSCNWIDINGNATGTEGCSYYDNGYWNNPCEQPLACDSYLTPGDGQKVCSPDGSEGTGFANGCNGEGCFLTAIECSCSVQFEQDYVDPSTCDPDCAGGGCAAIGDISNDCEPLPPCTEFFPGTDVSDVCGGMATSCTNADEHCYDKDFRCECTGTDVNGNPYGAGAVFIDCFPGMGTPAGCTPDGCTNSLEAEYCLNTPQSCADDYYGTGECSDSIDCQGTGCFYSQCDDGACIDASAVEHDCLPGCGGDNADDGCWVGECLPNFNCEDPNPCNPDNIEFGTSLDCEYAGCWAYENYGNEACFDGSFPPQNAGPRGNDGQTEDSLTPTWKGCCTCGDGQDAVDYSFSNCFPGCLSSEGYDYPGCNDPCTEPETCQDQGFQCGDNGTGDCGNVLEQCFDPDTVTPSSTEFCPCDRPKRCSCTADHCNTSQHTDGAGVHSCETAGTDCSSVCDEPQPCETYNTGGCTINYNTGDDPGIADDCLGDGCVIGDVDPECCNDFYVNNFQGGGEYQYCPHPSCGGDANGGVCAGGSLSDAYNNGSCEIPYATCQEFNQFVLQNEWNPSLTCTTVNENYRDFFRNQFGNWADPGPYNERDWTPCGWWETLGISNHCEPYLTPNDQGSFSGVGPWLPSCDEGELFINSCFEREGTNYWEQCSCDDGPSARNCNSSTVMCSDLTAEECMSIDPYSSEFDMQEPDTPGQGEPHPGCRWRYISPMRCEYYQRDYVTLNELEFLEYQFNNEDLNPASGGGVINTQNCGQYCIGHENTNHSVCETGSGIVGNNGGLAGLTGPQAFWCDCYSGTYQSCPGFDIEACCGLPAPPQPPPPSDPSEPPPVPQFITDESLAQSYCQYELGPYYTGVSCNTSQELAYNLIDPGPYCIGEITNGSFPNNCNGQYVMFALPSGQWAWDKDEAWRVHTPQEQVNFLVEAFCSTISNQQGVEFVAGEDWQVNTAITSYPSVPVNAQGPFYCADNDTKIYCLPETYGIEAGDPTVKLSADIGGHPCDLGGLNSSAAPDGGATFGYCMGGNSPGTPCQVDSDCDYGSTCSTMNQADDYVDPYGGYTGGGDADNQYYPAGQQSALNTQQGEETTYYSNLGTCKCIVASHPQMQCGYPEDYNGIFFKDFTPDGEMGETRNDCTYPAVPVCEYNNYTNPNLTNTCSCTCVFQVNESVV